MGDRGPAPKPTVLKVLHGDRKDRVNVAEPQPASEDVVPPWPLTREAQGFWDRLAPDRIAKGVLTAWDTESFALFCEALVLARGKVKGAKGRGKPGASSPLSEFRAAVAVVASLGARFGWTPSDRAKLSRPEAPADAKERLLS